MLQNVEEEINQDILDNFDEKRRVGENESEICQIIRKNSLEMFISYVNRTNYSISNRIQPSIFETNQLLQKNSRH